MVEKFELLYLKVRVQKYKNAFKRKYHREATIEDLMKCISNDDCPNDSRAFDDIDSTREKDCLNSNVQAMDLDPEEHQYGCIWCVAFIIVFIAVLYNWSL